MSLSQGSRCLSCQHGLVWECCCRTWPRSWWSGSSWPGRCCASGPAARAGAAVCPACGRSSRRVHSRYERRLADAAIGGQRVIIRLQVRRLFCDEPGLYEDDVRRAGARPRRRYARKTELLAGHAARHRGRAGRPGGCPPGPVAAGGGEPVDLLRLVMAVPDPAAAALRVLGVDLSGVPCRPSVTSASVA